MPSAGQPWALPQDEREASMSKTRTYSVVNNRLQFKCPFCQARRMIALPPDVRRKSIRCQKCGELSHCQLNRRIVPRQSQAGKALLILNDGKELAIDLYDISFGGVGFELSGSIAATISVRQEVKLRCAWNPRLLDQGRFVIKSVKGRRVGVQIIGMKSI